MSAAASAERIRGVGAIDDDVGGGSFKAGPHRMRPARAMKGVRRQVHVFSNLWEKELTKLTKPPHGVTLGGLGARAAGFCQFCQ